MKTPPSFFFFFNDTATTEIYTLSLHDALPISRGSALSISAAVGIARPDAGFLELAQLLLGDAGVLVLDPLAPLLAAAVAQPEDGGLGVGREVAVVFDRLGPALDLQDLHVLVGEALGLLQQRMDDVGVGDVAAI